jgi:hypothetical protein
VETTTTDPGSAKLEPAGWMRLEVRIQDTLVSRGVVPFSTSGEE